jgi:hypothetical protein
MSPVLKVRRRDLLTKLWWNERSALLGHLEIRLGGLNLIESGVKNRARFLAPF